MIQRKDIFIHGWDLAFDVEGWYPPLKAALNDVDFKQASWKAEGKSSHTIAELVNHLLYYTKRFLFRLERKSWPYTISTNDESFNNISTADLWNSSLQELSDLHQNIKKKIEELADGELDLSLPEASIGEQVLNLIMHDAYHTGQIVLIRKLYGSWPETRDV